MTVNSKILQIQDKKITLEYIIRKRIDFEDQIIVLMYDDVVMANNVICFDMQGVELWKINDILNIKRPTGNVDIIKEKSNILLVYSVLGIVYKIDIEKKELIEKFFLR